ncbi:MAG TPA: tetratricopeptide repeat protein [Candidatus Limnocylindrales bacterium]
MDTGVGVTPQQFLAAWGEDARASAAGAVRVEPAGGEVFVPGLVELVVLPAAVNIAPPALYDVVKRVLGRVRGDREAPEMEIMEVVSDSRDRMVVVRSRRHEFGEAHGAAITYHQLGIVAQEPRRLEQAERYYRRALDIKLESGDRHGAAGICGQLGVMAQSQRRFEQAELYYRRALDICQEDGERHLAAITYHNLGIVAQEQQRFEQAEQCYRQALDIYLECGERHLAGIACHTLGTLAQEQRRFEQAERDYRQALEIWLEREERLLAATTYRRLGTVTSELGRPIAAVEAMLSAEVLLYGEMGMWLTLDKLRAHTQHVTPEAFERLVQEIVPPDDRDSFLDALHQTTQS